MAKSKNEKGQATLILVLVLALVLVGGMGLAIDGARLYNTMQMAQVGADAAATSAMMSIFQGINTGATSFGTAASFTCSTADAKLPCQYARMNGFGANSYDHVTVEFPTCTGTLANPGGSCGYADKLATNLPAGTPNLVKVTIQRDVSNGLIRMLGMGALTEVQTSATAATIAVQSPTPLIITDYKNSGSLAIIGGGSVNNIVICGGPSQAIQVNSSAFSPSPGDAYSPPSSTYIDLTHAGPGDTTGQCTTSGTGANFGIFGGPGGSGGGTVNRVELGTTGQYMAHSPIPDPYENVANPTEPLLPNAPQQVNSASSPNYGCTRTAALGGCWVFSPGKYGNCTGCTPFVFKSTGGAPNWPTSIGAVDYIIFKPGLYYIEGGGATFKNVHGGTVGLDSTNPIANSTICTGCGSDTDLPAGQGMTVFNTGNGTGNHNADAFTVDTGSAVSFQGPTNTQVVQGQTVPGPPYYGLAFWNDNQSTNFIPHNLGQGGGCFQVTGTIYITPTLAIMKANSGQTSYQVVKYHGTPCSATVTKGDIVVSDLQLDGTAQIKMNLVPFGFLYTYQVALVGGGVHP